MKKISEVKISEVKIKQYIFEVWEKFHGKKERISAHYMVGALVATLQMALESEEIYKEYQRKFAE